MVWAIGSNLALAGPVVPQDVLERALQLVERELVAQRGHHLLGQTGR